MSSENTIKLRKALSFQDLTFLSVTGMVGSGWLFASLGAAAYAGPAAIISWIIGGAFFIIMGFAFAELGGLLPFTGSLVRINHFTHGSLSNYYLGWAYLIGVATTVPLEAEAVISYTNRYLPIFSTQAGVLTPLGIVAAAALILVFLIIQLIGVNVAGKTNTIITWWKFIVPTITAILLISLAFHTDNFSHYGGFLPFGYEAIFSALVPSGIVFAYEGFRQALEYAGEARNPHRDVPRAIIVSIVLVILLYVLLQVSFIGAINWSTIKLVNSEGQVTGPITPGDWGNLLNSNWAGSPFYSSLLYSGVAFLASFAIVLLIDAWISPAATMGVYLGTTARSFYGLSKQGYYPNLFSSLHPRFQTPWFSLIFTFFLSVIFLLPFPSWYSLVSLSASATVVNYLASGPALIVLRRTAKELKRPYESPVPWLVASLSFIFSSMLIYWTGWPGVGWVFLVTAFGLPLFLLGYGSKLNLSKLEVIIFTAIFWSLLSADAFFGLYESLWPFTLTWGLFSALLIMGTIYLYLKSHSVEVKASSWFIAYMIITGVMAYIGSGGTGLIQYPLDYVIMIIISTIIFIVTVKQGFETEEIRQIKEHGLPVE
ncbi:MAG: APC family permease [Thermocladium sp.]